MAKHELTDEFYTELFAKTGKLIEDLTETIQSARSGITKANNANSSNFGMVVQAVHIQLEQGRQLLLKLRAEQAKIPAQVPPQWEQNKIWVNTMCASLSEIEIMQIPTKPSEKKSAPIGGRNRFTADTTPTTAKEQTLQVAEPSVDTGQRSRKS